MLFTFRVQKLQTGQAEERAPKVFVDLLTSMLEVKQILDTLPPESVLDSLPEKDSLPTDVSNRSPLIEPKLLIAMHTLEGLLQRPPTRRELEESTELPYHTVYRFLPRPKRGQSMPSPSGPFGLVGINSADLATEKLVEMNFDTGSVRRKFLPQDFRKFRRKPRNQMESTSSWGPPETLWFATGFPDSLGPGPTSPQETNRLREYYRSTIFIDAYRDMLTSAFRWLSGFYLALQNSGKRESALALFKSICPNVFTIGTGFDPSEDSDHRSEPADASERLVKTPQLLAEASKVLLERAEAIRSLRDEDFSKNIIADLVHPLGPSVHFLPGKRVHVICDSCGHSGVTEARERLICGACGASYVSLMG